MKYNVDFEIFGKKFNRDYNTSRDCIRRNILNDIIYYKLEKIDEDNEDEIWSVNFELYYQKMRLTTIYADSPSEVIKIIENKLIINKITENKKSYDKNVDELLSIFGIKK